MFRRENLTARELDEIAWGHEIVAQEYRNRGEWFAMLAEDFREQAEQARAGKRAAS